MVGKKRIKLASTLGLAIILSLSTMVAISWAAKDSTNDSIASKGKVSANTLNQSGNKGTVASEPLVIPQNVSIGKTNMDSDERGPIHTNDNVKSQKEKDAKEKNEKLLFDLSSLSAMVSMLLANVKSLMERPKVIRSKLVANQIATKVTPTSNGTNAAGLNRSSVSNMVSVESNKLSAPPPAAPVKASTTVVKNAGTVVVKVKAASVDTVGSPWALRILELTNNHRAAHGLNPVKLTNIMMKSSLVKAMDMEKNNEMTHYSPTLGNPLQQMRSEGIQGGVAENVAMNTGDGSADTVFNMWKNSPPHNENLLLPEAKTMGVSKSGAFFAQQFTF